MISTQKRYSKCVPKLTRLRLVRERRALSQIDLADAADVAQTTLSRLENGTTSAQPRTLRKLAKVLRVDPAELIGPDEMAS